MRAVLFVLMYALGMAGAWAGGLDLVATAPSMGALAREVGGGEVRVTVLAAPDRDLHSLQAKPSMIRALRGADLLVAIGAELEMGWLPAASTSAANPKILPGAPGYFEGAAQVSLKEMGTPATRALGDVHPVGNPHVDLDPVRMARIGEALAERLALIDPAGAAGYRQRARAFSAAVDKRLPEWERRLTGAPGAVLYHRDAVYLLDRFGVPLLGTVEPIPGVPPTGRQIAELAGTLRDRSGVILYAPYHSPKAPEKLARELGWEAHALPLEPPLDADGAGYLAHIDRWVETLAGPR